MQQRLRQKVVLTTCFSGMACAETAALMCNDVLSDGTEPGFVIFSACDVDALPLRVLQEVRTSEHLFIDILHRLPSILAEHLKSLAKSRIEEYNQMAKSMLSQFKRGQVPPSVKAELLEAKQRKGNELMVEVLKVLDDVEMLSEAECLMHPGKMCPVTPRLQEQHKHRLWFEVAGPICKPWCSIGSRRMWLDTATVPCLTWVVSIRYFQPDGVLLENAPEFKEDIVHDLLNGISRSLMDNGLAVVPRPIIPAQCPHTAKFRSSSVRADWDVSESEPARKRSAKREAAKASQETYSCNPFTFCPSDVGWPMRRRRKYTWFFLQQRIIITVSSAPFINLVFFCKPLLRGSDLLSAVSAEERRAFILQQLKLGKDGGASMCVPDEDLEELSFDATNALTPAMKVRAAGYMEIAQRQGLVDKGGSWKSLQQTCCVVNLAQTPGYAGLTKHEFIPTLLCGSHLYDLASGTAVMAKEHLTLLGFSLPDAEGLPDTDGAARRLKRRFPFPRLISDTEEAGAAKSLTELQVRKLSGNAMHLQSVGIMLIFALACVQEQPS